MGGARLEGLRPSRLQSSRSALVASLILAALIAGWHLPLMVAGQVHYSDIVLILAGVIVFNWVFNNTGGSVLIIMLMHAANNAVSGSFFSRCSPEPTPFASPGYWHWSGASWLSW